MPPYERIESTTRTDYASQMLQNFLQTRICTHYIRPMWTDRLIVPAGVLMMALLACVLSTAAAAPTTRDSNPLGGIKGTFDVEIVSGQQRFERTFTDGCGTSSGVVEVTFKKGQLPSSTALLGGVPAKDGPWPWYGTGGFGGYVPVNAKIVARGEHWVMEGDSCQRVTCAYDQDFNPKDASYAVNFNSQIPEMTLDGFALVGLFNGMKLGPGCDPWSGGTGVQSGGVLTEFSPSSRNTPACSESRVWCAPLSASKLAKIRRGKSTVITLARIQQSDPGSEETITSTATWKVRITRRT